MQSDVTLIMLGGMMLMVAKGLVTLVSRSVEAEASYQLVYSHGLVRRLIIFRVKCRWQICRICRTGLLEHGHYGQKQVGNRLYHGRNASDQKPNE